MSKNIFPLATFLFLAALIIPTGCRWSAPDDSVAWSGKTLGQSRALANQLNSSMTKEQVIALMGEPDGEFKDSEFSFAQGRPCIVLRYFFDGGFNGTRLDIILLRGRNGRHTYLKHSFWS